MSKRYAMLVEKGAWACCEIMGSRCKLDTPCKACCDVASMIANLALAEAEQECIGQMPQGDDEFTKGYRMACEENADYIRTMKEKT